MTDPNKGITLKKIILCKELLERRTHDDLQQHETRSWRKAKGRVVEPKQIQNHEPGQAIHVYAKGACDQAQSDCKSHC